MNFLSAGSINMSASFGDILILIFNYELEENNSN